MKKILVFLLLSIFTFSSVYAEQVVNPSFGGMTGAFQQDEDDGVFYKINNGGGAYIYDKDGSTLDSVSYQAGNTDYTNISFGDGRLLSLNYGTQSFNYTYYRQATFVNLDEGDIKWTGFRSVQAVGGGTLGLSGGSAGTRYCRTGYRMAVQGGKILIQGYRDGSGNSNCSSSSSAIVEAINDSTTNPDLQFSTHTGNITAGEMIDTSTIDNHYMQVIGDGAMIYKKKNNDNQIFILQCNDFEVCTEDLLFGVTNLVAGFYIKAFKFHYTSTNGSFGYVNILVYDGTNYGLLYLPFTLDENGAFDYADSYVYDKWIHKEFVEGNGYKLFVYGPDLAVNGVEPEFGVHSPLVVWEDNLIADDDFWYVKDDNQLWNFGSTYNGVISENTGDTSGGGGDGGTGTGSTGTGSTGTGSITYDDSIFNFDQDGDGEIGLLNGEIFIGIGNAIKYFFNKIMEFFGNIKSLIEKLSEAFTSEEKSLSFNFIPKANAEGEISGFINNNVDEVGYHETTLGKIDLLIKGFIAFFILVIGLAFFIGINRNKND